MLIALMLPALAAAGTITRTFTFSPDEVSFARVNGYDVAQLRDFVSTSAPGEPIVPRALYSFLVPAGATVTDVAVVDSRRAELPGIHRLHPAQQPRPLSSAEPPRFEEPLDAVYRSAGEFPGRAVEFGNTGTKSGFRVCGISLFPLQYSPATGRVALYTSLTIRVEYAENSVLAVPMTAAQQDWTALDLRSLVVNPDDIKAFAPPTRHSDPADAEYVIITSDTYIATLQPLADWHARKGYATQFKTVSWITGAYPGRDTQEKIRNFIIDYWQNHGTIFVLLAGANSVIPARRGRSICGGYTGNIPADLYYQDLQWSWDGNNNGTFGEADGDTVDFYTDIYIGRAPIASAANAQTFVSKVTTYENSPNTGFIKKTYLPWVPLFTGYTGEAVSDTIANLTPPGWTDTKVGTPSTSAFQSAINAGYGYCHGAAHGDDYGFYTDLGSPIYTTTQAAAQTNGFDKLVIMNSMACISGNFENQSCLSVTLQNNANGGSVANMMNSRYGWGTPPSMGPSEKLCVRFFDFFLNYDSFPVGIAHSRGKDWYASLAPSQEVWRWCFYDYNLLGDPGMPVWSDVPGTMIVAAPDTLSTGTQSVRVTVTSGGSPLANARVGFCKSGEVYARGTTNSSGQADVLVSPTTTGTIYITAYAQDKLPVRDSATVVAGAPRPYVVLQGTYVDDGGNNRLDPGETVNLYVTIRNAGNTAATATQGRLRTASGHVTLIDTASSYGSIAAGDTARGDNYRLSASSSTPPGSRIPLTVAVSSAEGTWDVAFELVAGAPAVPGAVTMVHDTGYCKLSVTALGSIGYTEPPGDAGNGFCYPKAGASQLYYSSLLVGNSTNYVADHYFGQPPSGAPNADFRIVDSLFPVLPPLNGEEHFRCVISDAGHPNPTGLRITCNSYQNDDPGYDDFAVLQYVITNGGGSSLTGLYAGVMADFDIGSNSATNTGASNETKHFTSMRAASSENPTVGVKILEPASFANLSCIDHARYVYPDSCMSDNQKYRWLNGTLSQRNSTRSYDWSIVTSVGPFDLAPGASYRCAFAFIGGTSAASFEADADSAQSWYDHFTGLAEPGQSPAAARSAGVTCRPNPFSRAVRVSCQVPAAGPVLVQVCDVTGRVLATLENRSLTAGDYEWHWQPGDLANGVYLLKVRHAGGTHTEKLTLLH
jgi:hypothetical protein